MTKQKILDWFRNDRSFETGKQLYMKHGVNLSFKNILNRAGNTPDNFKFLCYELAKMAGIPERQYKQILKTPVKKEKTAQAAPAKAPEIDLNELPVEKLTADFLGVDVDKLNYWKCIEIAEALEIELPSRKKEAVYEALKAFQSQQTVRSVPDPVRRGFKLREEFPFLKKKECPGVLKELVADMLTAYDNYVEGHRKLVEAMDEQVIAELSQSVVEDYLENRMIWEELEHYKKTGELLAKHPIFDWHKRREEIRSLTTPDLVKLKDQLENKIPRTRKLISDEPDHKETEKRQQRLSEFERELTEVKAILGLKDA